MKLDKDCIYLWVFEDAPPELKKLSENGGDEDWLMYVPERLEEDYRVMGLVESQAFDKGCAPEEHEVDGGFVYIGSHS